MNNKKYLENVIKTELDEKQYMEAKNDRIDYKKMRLLHGAIGCATEAGELLDQIKKHVFYGKELDETNIMEEVGDLFWYCSICLDAAGYDIDDSMKKNIEKLASRYKDGFSEEKALKRDLNKERKILEE